MGEEIDLDDQNQFVPETTSFVDSPASIRDYCKDVFSNYQDQILAIYPLIYLGWLLFYITYIYRSLYVTGANHQICEYDHSLVSSMNNTVNALEKAMEGSTKNIGQLLPEQWPHGFYTVTYSGLCRENDDSEKVCYKGLSAEDLILRDVGVQIAEINKMENPVQFGEKFMLTYRDVQGKLKKELERRKTCRYTLGNLVCFYKGLTNDEVQSLPRAENAMDFKLFASWLTMSFAVLSLPLIMWLWMGDVDINHPLILFLLASSFLQCFSSLPAVTHDMEVLYLTAWYFDIRLFSPAPTVHIIALVFAVLSFGNAFWLACSRLQVNPTILE